MVPSRRTPARSDTPRLPQCRHWTATQDRHTDLTPIEPRVTMLPPAEVERKLNAAKARIREMTREIDQRDELIFKVQGVDRVSGQQVGMLIQIKRQLN